MNKKLVIVRKTTRRGAQESGCCFTSCGGSPLMQGPVEKSESLTIKRIKRIKQY